MLAQKRRLALVLAGIIGVSMFMSSVVAASPAASADIRTHGRKYNHRRYRYPRRRPRDRVTIRITDKNIDRLIAIGGIYVLARAISEIGRSPREVVYVSPPPPRCTSTPSPQPTYTPSVRATQVTVRNDTDWYIALSMNGMELDLNPGREQTLSWTYTGREHPIRAWAYRDPYHRRLLGTYEGNLTGYEIPWTLNFDYDSFVYVAH